MFVGIKVYDIFVGFCGFESFYVMSKDEVLQKFFIFCKDYFVGVFVYYDGQYNDFCMNVLLVFIVLFYGVIVLNYVEVMNLEKDVNGKICGVVVKDFGVGLSGDEVGVKEFFVCVKGVINVIGLFIDVIEKMDDGNCKDFVVFVLGIYVMFFGDFCLVGMGMFDVFISDGCVVFVLLW